LALCLAVLWGSAGIAHAASSAWKLVAVTGPTNLPPTQSETQRIAVEAEGGDFTLAATMAKGEGTLGFASGFAITTEGSNQVPVFFPTGTFEVGRLVSGEGIPAGTTILGISGTSTEPVLELSDNATSSGFTFVESASKEVTAVTTSLGQFSVGQGIAGPGIAPGTTIVAVGPDTLTLSDNPSGGGTVALTTSGTTAPLPFDASAEVVQDALEALPGASPGMFAVTGGPGGNAEHPYFVSFDGPFADEDIDALGADGSGLDGEHAAVHVFTTLPGGRGTGEIAIMPTNIGALATSGQSEVKLGPLPPGIVTTGPGTSSPGPDLEDEAWSCPGGPGESTVVCTSSVSVPGANAAIGIRIPVKVEPDAVPGTSVPVSISGGGAGSATYQMPIAISTQEAPAGPQAFWAGAFDSDGNLETQAGAHPASVQNYLLFNTVRSPSGKIIPASDLKNVIVDLPSGLLGNPSVTQRCPQSQVTPTPSCNTEMDIGEFRPVAGRFGAQFSNPSRVFNDIPAQGYAAEFTTFVTYPLLHLLGSVRSSEDFGVRILAPNIPTYDKVFGAYSAFKGEPAGAHGKAFLTNSSACAEEARQAPAWSTSSDTWQEPDIYSFPLQQTLPPVTGCDKLEFAPSLDFQPTTTQGSSPTGATAHLHIPQERLTEPGKLAEPPLDKAVVTLPAGLSLNPSSANGLQACTEAQIGYLGAGALPNPTRFNEAPPTCPDGSKLGTVEVKTPLLEEELDGTIYLAAQEENPFNSLIALYLTIDSPRYGIEVKLPGKVEIDPSTGQLTATFDHNPQLPFEDVTLHFSGGPTAQLATPEVCGHYKTTGSLTPWSAPESGPPAQIEEAGFNVSGGCSASAATRPFAPSFEAGTTGTQAGAYSPMVINVARRDGEQELKSLDFTLPKGLIGKLAGIPYCSDAAIATAEGRSGKAEQAAPSCPAAGRLGKVDTAAGVGDEPVHVGGNVYLAGPYKGAPISAVVITPGVAGPFDLGNVVIRAPLYIDPDSAQLTVKSDPVPTMLKGIPLKLRSVAIQVDRDRFMLNPTSCEPMSASASLGSSDGATATPSNRFQVGGCDKLKFSPKLKLALKGGTRRNGHPALVATLTQPSGQANIGRVSVALPHSEFLDQNHIRTICTRVQFAADACPKGAIYGHAEAVTPLLDQPLRGPVYLRSNGGERELPDLVAALRGPASQPVEVELTGYVDSVNDGIRNSFELLPDAPVSKFVLRMQGGRKGLLVNSTNLCRGTHKAAVKMEGQNGKAHNFSSSLQARCKKPRDKHKQ